MTTTRRPVQPEWSDDALDFMDRLIEGDRRYAELQASIDRVLWTCRDRPEHLSIKVDDSPLYYYKPLPQFPGMLPLFVLHRTKGGEVLVQAVVFEQ